MNSYKSQSVLKFMSDNDFQGDPKDLLRKLVYADLNTIEALGGVDNVPNRLKFLSSYRGLSEPNLIELADDQSGNTDGNQININSNHPESRRLFTWAHEIIHSYFSKSAGIKIKYFGGEFHCSAENSEEESLCDFGASIVLFYRHEPDSFKVESLLNLMESTGASAEACASSMLDHFKEKYGFVIWIRKCKKGENPDQTSMFEEESKQPFRIDYAISKNTFLPKNKSVNEGEAIEECESCGRSSGSIYLDLNPNGISLETDNLLISNGRVLTLFKLLKR